MRERAAAARRGSRGGPRGRCGAINRGGRESWRARQGRRGRRVCRPDSARVRARLEVGDGPDRWGPPVGGREEGGANWAGKMSLGRVLAGTRNGLRFGLRGKERKKERREIGPAGLKRDGEREKCFAFSFEIDSNLFNSNLNSGEFKLELNNKQWNNALRHECNTKITTSINLENNQYLFSLTLNSL